MSFRSVFPLGQPKDEKKGSELTDYEKAILDKLAKKVIHWKMAIPAIIALESVKPLNYIGSQTMVFFEPIVQSIFNITDYDTFRQMMERRETIEDLLKRIEYFDAIAIRKEKLFKKLKREYMKKQTFGFKLKSAILGFRVPSHLEEEWKAKLAATEKEEENQSSPSQ